MAIIYVDSVGGSNTSPYDTWAKAATTYETGAASWGTGDVVWVEIDHTESFGSAQVFSGGTIAELMPVFLMDNSDDSYAPSDGTGTITFTTSSSNHHLTFPNTGLNGVNIDVTGNVSSSSPMSTRIDDCYIATQQNGAGILVGVTNSDAVMTFNETTIDGGFGFRISGSSSHAVFTSCIFKNLVFSGGMVYMISNRNWAMDFNYCDFSGFTDSTVIMCDTSNWGNGGGNVNFVGCKFPTPATSFALTDGIFGNDNQSVTTWHSDQSSDLFPLTREGKRGILDTNTTTYHDAGWVDADQDTNLSHEMASSSSATIEAPLQSFDIIQWYDATDTITVTIECWDEFTTALQNDEAWMEVFFLDGTSVTVSMDSTQVKAVAGSNLTAGTGAANWTGEPSGRSVKFVSGSLSIGKEGLIIARIYLGKFESGKSLFVDPMMTIA